MVWSEVLYMLLYTVFHSFFYINIMYTVAVSIIVIDEQNLILLFVLVKYKKNIS